MTTTISYDGHHDRDEEARSASERASEAEDEGNEDYAEEWRLEAGVRELEARFATNIHLVASTDEGPFVDANFTPVLAPTQSPKIPKKTRGQKRK